MLSRRTFHKSLAATMLATLAGGMARAAAGDDPAGLYLGRLTHGVTPASRAAFDTLGLRDWLEAELAKPALDPALADRLARAELWIEHEAGRTDDGLAWPAVAEMRPLAHVTGPGDPAEIVELLDWTRPIGWGERERPGREVIAVSMLRAVHADAQLREVMTQFWHDHFNVTATKDELSMAFFANYDAALRQHALGNFRRLLGEVARAPSMLHYLNNAESRASPANENFARELLELHTLGQAHYFNALYDDWKAVPGAREGLAEGYIDQDVYEVARAFTGWTIGDGRWLMDEEHAPRTGRMHYVEAWHDPYQKRVLGVEFGPNAAAMEDGERVLDLLAGHPGTARFVSGKILRRLGIEAPSVDYLDKVAAVFLRAHRDDDQIAQVIRTAVLHPEFAATPPRKLRRPFEIMAALYRTTGVDVEPKRGDIYWLLAQAGWTQHEVRPPTGHSDRTEDWAHTRMINGVIAMIHAAHGEWHETVGRPLARMPQGATTAADLVRHWAGLFGADPGEILPVLAELGVDAETEMGDDADFIEWVSTAVITPAALGPQLLFR